MRKIIISAPSLDSTLNVSGVSSVVNFIIDNNKDSEYLHFEIGKRDNEKGGVGRVKSILRAIGTWRKMLKANPDAIIHYSFPLSAPSILRDPLFMWIARMKGMKMVVHIHGGVYLTSPKIPFVLEKIMRWVFSWDVPFIVLSDSEKDTLQNRFDAKEVVSLPNCVDLSDAIAFVRSSKKGSLRIGYLGRIAETKGMGYLLEACKRLKQGGIDFVLDIAGKEEVEGQYLPDFERELGVNFHYSGVVSGEKKNHYLRCLDVFVLPSYFEGLPISLLECMSYGCVPVTTPVGSIPGVVVDGENGIFIKVKDSESIVEAITRIAGNPERISTLGSKARESVFRDFSPVKYVEQLNKVYDSLGSV